VFSGSVVSVVQLELDLGEFVQLFVSFDLESSCGLKDCLVGNF